MKKQLPSQQELLDYFSYNSATGDLVRIKADKNHPFAVGKVVGCVDSDGYLVASLHGVSFKVHRLIFKLITGNEPDQIDHINRNKQDNRIENLRSCDVETNVRNKDNSRNILGTDYFISFHKATQKYQLSYHKSYIGVFPSYQEALDFLNKNVGLTKKPDCNPWDGLMGVVYHKSYRSWQATVPKRFRKEGQNYCKTGFASKEEAQFYIQNYIENKGGCYA